MESNKPNEASPPVEADLLLRTRLVLRGVTFWFKEVGSWPA